MGRFKMKKPDYLNNIKVIRFKSLKKIHRFLIISSVLEIFVKPKMYLGWVTNLEFTS